MAVKSSSYNPTLEVITEWAVGSTKVTASSEMKDNVKFTNGAGALQFTDVIEASINANGTPVALSSLSSPAGASGSSFTKLKGIGLYNPPTNNAISLASSASGAGLHVGRVDPGATIIIPYPSAAGITVTGATTFTATGTAGQFLRVLLLLA